ncbi:hypothetical protein [Lactobacillus mulieris]|uniref:Uncharacterized protein n=1 Tax=Lactobacillus mulieris TaxID=2508708 RepID=A0ABT4JZR8_9LACO|nr:hypothetical protein [Lactobacillus mulieris]MCZ3621369.1 hypothetical protein [Lactobacillus mulieris]MCZ3623355.1 hypothetical protein [Lactobacillus mulieris]MCZ3635376.1 hypothetical protein [Lactobacillus mulieris]
MQKLVEKYNYLDLKNVNGFKFYKFNPKKKGGAVVNNVLKNLTGLNLKTANIEQIQEAAQEKGFYIRTVYKFKTKSGGYDYNLINNKLAYAELYNDVTYLIVKKSNDCSIWQLADERDAFNALKKIYYYNNETLYRLKLGKWLDSHTFNVQKEVISLTKEEAETWGEF